MAKTRCVINWLLCRNSILAGPANVVRRHDQDESTSTNAEEERGKRRIVLDEHVNDGEHTSGTERDERGVRGAARIQFREIEFRCARPTENSSRVIPGRLRPGNENTLFLE